MTRLAGGIVNVTDFPRVRYIRKSASESVTSSTTMQDDNDLQDIVLAANQDYRVDFYPAVTAAATGGDVKFGWTFTGTGNGIGTRNCMGPQIGTTDVTNTQVRISRHNTGTAVAYGHDGTNTPFIYETFLVTGGASGGTITLQWAQNASNATATQLSTSTYMTIQEVEEY